MATNNPSAKMLQVIASIESGTVDALHIACSATVGLAKQNATDLEAVDRGILRSSIAYDVDKHVGVVFVGAGHGIWVELGRAGVLTNPTKHPAAAKAAWPPVQTIRDWVVRNYRKLAPSGRTQSGRARKPHDADVDAATFLIGRKIFLHGIKPRPYLIPAYKRVLPKWTLILHESINRRLAAIKI